jgi:hypothetical protein
MAGKNIYLNLVMAAVFENCVAQEEILAGGKAWFASSNDFLKVAKETGMTLGEVYNYIRNALAIHKQVNISTEEGMFVINGKFCSWNIRQIDSVKRDLPPQTPENPASICYIVNLLTQEEFVHKKYYEYREKHLPNMPF